MLRRLTSSVNVKAPSSFALASINTYVLERGLQTNGADVALRFALPAFILEGLTIEKRVRLHLTYDHNPRAISDHPLTISWQPQGTGPLPSFEGSLSATPQGETACRLSIAGSYKPPGGVAGGIFDSLIGVRIADATLSALLGQFAQSIDADFAARSRG